MGKKEKKETKAPPSDVVSYTFLSVTIVIDFMFYYYNVSTFMKSSSIAFT